MYLQGWNQLQVNGFIASQISIFQVQKESIKRLDFEMFGPILNEMDWPVFSF